MFESPIVRRSVQECGLDDRFRSREAPDQCCDTYKGEPLVDHSILSRLRAVPLALALAFALLVATLISSVLIASAALADEGKKTFEVSIFPTEVVAGVATDVTFTFKNTSEPMITMGSANITIPDGVEVAGHSGVIELRTMKLGERKADTNPREYTFTVTAICPEDEEPVEWTIAAKQANNFSGTGNDFDLDNSDLTMTVTCEAITEPETDPYDGPPGLLPKSTPDGGWDAFDFCPGKKPCGPATTSSGDTSAELILSGNITAWFMSLRDDVDLSKACGDDFDGASGSAALYFHAIGDPKGKQVVITIENATDADDYEVCFGSDKRFTQANGDPAVYDGSFYWVGVIGDCPAQDAPGKRPTGGKDGGVGKPVACVSDRSSDAGSGTVMLTIDLPPGDPLIKIG